MIYLSHLNHTFVYHVLDELNQLSIYEIIYLKKIIERGKIGCQHKPFKNFISKAM